MNVTCHVTLYKMVFNTEITINTSCYVSFIIRSIAILMI